LASPLSEDIREERPEKRKNGARREAKGPSLSERELEGWPVGRTDVPCHIYHTIHSDKPKLSVVGAAKFVLIKNT